MAPITASLSETGEKPSSASAIPPHSKGSVNWSGNNRVSKSMKVAAINT
ncbi:Uncharacterised protein [Vibrio cholerae]|nr:Uncharacterised protein [Vibrio cholerae]CSB38184.1 Uncharacterised protein [Vibrio cholerae]CSB81287.1 Uncharacterised protein [Vibrio cholerae]CSC09994.1 Uncharacterised protein [Vibrio cholerae]CSC51141.1 Uncharacterised protein [Vibrio cholerae]